MEELYVNQDENMVIFTLIEMNGNEYTFTYNISLLPKKYKFLAIDMDCILFAYVERPEFSFSQWLSDNEYVEIMAISIQCNNFRELIVEIER